MKTEFWKTQLGEEWSAALADLLSSEYAEKLLAKVNSLYKETVVYPKKSDVFRAFRLTGFKDVRVVILGQDPYHDGSSTGLAFANSRALPDVSMSPSLKKIHGAWEKVSHGHFYFDDTLEPWAEQGVLLLNTALTVEKRKPGSHTKYWKKFTEGVLSAINRDRPDVICLLWGKQAQEYKPLLNNCTVLEYSHPASAIYNGTDWDCPHFDQVNEILTKSNGPEFQILW